MAGAPAPELVGSPPMVSALCDAGGREGGWRGWGPLDE